MGRQARVFVTGLPHHIVQRGHNRNAVFSESSDYEYYLSNLAEWKSHYNVAVYAYCLMTNHVHLILAPRTAESDVSGLMRRLSARQGRRVNKLEGRVGTVWSGRFKNSVIDADSYLLACLRYVELNPVRAGMVRRPENYRWSSYPERLGICDGGLLDLDPVTEALGSNLAARREAYRKFVLQSEPIAEREFIRTAVRRNQLTGDSRFIDEIERRTGVRIDARKQGRPKSLSPGK